MCACPSSEVCNVEDRTEGVQNHINRLPVEILTEILSYLPLRRLFVVQRVCRRWRDTVALLISNVQQFRLRIISPIIGHVQYVGLYSETSEVIFYHLEDTSLEAVLEKMSGLKRLEIVVILEKQGGRREACESPTSMVANIRPDLVEMSYEEYRRWEAEIEVFELKVVKVSHMESKHYGIAMRFNRHFAIGDCTSSKGSWLPMLPNTLEELVLVNCLLSEDVARLGEYCPNLVDLDVTGICHITSEDFRSMLLGLPRLRKLSTMGDSLKTDVSPDNVSDQMTSLVVYDITDDILQRIVNKLPHLTSLTLGRQEMMKRHERAPTETGLLQIAQLKQLSKLTFDNIVMPTTVLNILHVLPIFELHLHGVVQLSEEDLTRFIMDSIQLRAMGFHHAKGVTAYQLHQVAELISPSCYLEIRDNKSGRLLAIFPETRSNTARRILVTVDELWYSFVDDYYYQTYGDYNRKDDYW